MTFMLSNRGPVLFFCMWLFSFSSPIYCPFCIVYSCFLCKKLNDHICVSLFLNFLFQWSMGLYFCQYHTVLITISLKYHLKSGSEKPPGFFLCLKITCLFGTFCCFIHILGLFVLFIWKVAIRILIKIAFNLQIA